MNAKLSRTVEKEHKIRTWVGDRERLDRIARLMEDVHQRTQEEPDAEALQKSQYRMLSRMIKEADEVQVTATESEGAVLKGDAAGVFDSMDRTALKRLEIELGTPLSIAAASFSTRRYVRIEFKHDQGVTFEAAGDQTWVDSFFPGISTELNRGEPWWSFMRGPFGFALLFALVSPALWATLARASPDSTTADRVFGSLFFGAVCAGAILALFRVVLPGFEVVLAGSSGRGRRALGVLGIVILAALGAVLPSLLN